jgi:hypothetical protein
MLGLRRLKGIRLSWREYIYLMLYTLALAFVAVMIHETAHIVSAIAFGVRFVELQPGFMGINPSIILPAWFTGTHRTVVYYAGGLTAGMVLLLFYLCYWMRKCRHCSTFFHWSLGLVTLFFTAVQFAFAYLEGHYHGAYILGPMSSFSPANLLAYGWAVSAVFFHSALCPWKMMRKAVDQ